MNRNLECQQNDNTPRSVCETLEKMWKLQKRRKSTKCYICFYDFPESSANNFYVISHLQVSQIPTITPKKWTGTWNVSRMTTFQGQSAKRRSTTKNFKNAENQRNAILVFITFWNHRQKIFMLFHIYKCRRFRKSHQKSEPELGMLAEWQHFKVSLRNVGQKLKSSKTPKINEMLYLFLWLSGIIGQQFFVMSHLQVSRFRKSHLWGAVCKNIISDRFSTKTAISGRDSCLCMQRCYLWQR